MPDDEPNDLDFDEDDTASVVTDLYIQDGHAPILVTFKDHHTGDCLLAVQWTLEFATELSEKVAMAVAMAERRRIEVLS